MALKYPANGVLAPDYIFANSIVSKQNNNKTKIDDNYET
jgi:hypothetical protein